MILDLNVFEEETLDITMAGGAVVRIPKPSEKMIIRIMRIGEINEQTDPERAARVMNDLTFWILDSNSDGMTFDRETVEALPSAHKLAILNAYTEFARKFQSNPT